MQCVKLCKVQNYATLKIMQCAELCKIQNIKCKVQNYAICNAQIYAILHSFAL